MGFRSRILVASLACAAPLAAPRAEALAVRADPPSLVLGADLRATVSVLAASCETPPRVSASAGRIDAVRALGGGRFEVGYLPPATSYPQVVIVAATSCGAWGWTAIPLAGRGVALARSAPHDVIRVTIGDASFGPVRADAEGEARVPVVVPAGVDRAYHQGRPLDLMVPPTLHVHLALGRDAAAADAAQEVPLRAFAVTPSGAPRAGAPVAVAVTAGEVTPLVEVAPGELAAVWRLPAGPAGPATATVRLADEDGLASAAVLERPAGAPVRLALDADRVRVVAGVDPPVVLRATVADAAGNPVDEAPRFEAALGVLSAPRQTAPGAWEARLELPAALKRAVRTDVVARAAGLEAKVAIDAGPLPAPSLPGVRRLSAAPKLGVAASRGGLAAAYLGAEGAWRTGLLGDRLSLAAEAGVFDRDRTDGVVVGEQRLAVQGRARYVPALVALRLHHAVGARQAVWASAGGGVAWVASDVSVGTGPVVSESGLVPLLHASAAWGLRVGRATPFAEARVAWHGDPGFAALQGSLTTLTVLLGCRYDAH